MRIIAFACCKLKKTSRSCGIIETHLLFIQWLIFNVLLGNEDARLKNLSFLLSAKNVHLSPFYDLLCTAVYGTRAFEKDQWPAQSEMAWPINGAQRLLEISTPLLIAAGETMGIKPTTARDNIQKLLDEVMQQNEQLLQDRPELRATLAGEVRLLRSINAIIINEMTTQLMR